MFQYFSNGTVLSSVLFVEVLKSALLVLVVEMRQFSIHREIISGLQSLMQVRLSDGLSTELLSTQLHVDEKLSHVVLCV